MNIFDTLFGNSTVVKDVVGGVADVVDKFVLTKDEKFKAAQEELEREWRFKELEQVAFKEQEERIVALYQTDAIDRKDAREFAKVEIASGDKFVSHFRYWFAAILCLIILVILSSLLWLHVPPENNNIIMYILGTLTSTFTVIVSFYFGSSSGSSIKDQVIKDQSKEIGKQSA